MVFHSYSCRSTLDSEVVIVNILAACSSRDDATCMVTENETAAPILHFAISKLITTVVCAPG